MKRLFYQILLVGIVICLAGVVFAQVETGVEKSAEGSGAVVAKVITSTATVVGIDYENRTGTLKLSDGTTVTFSAGPEVRNFEQMKVGDEVLVRN